VGGVSNSVKRLLPKAQKPTPSQKTVSAGIKSLSATSSTMPSQRMTLAAIDPSTNLKSTPPNSIAARASGTLRLRRPNTRPARGRLRSKASHRNQALRSRARSGLRRSPLEVGSGHWRAAMRTLGSGHGRDHLDHRLHGG
jgi:hypothetical protein